MKTIKFLSSLLLLGIILISTACKDDDFVAVAPTSDDATYSYVFDTENPNRVIFKADTQV
jgi:hypothetical protein